MSNHPLSALVASYIQSRANAKQEKFDKEASKQRKALVNNDAANDALALATLEAALASEQQEINSKYRPDAWLSDAANRAKQISLVTHALKFTHTDAKGSSIYSDEKAGDCAYLSTASLHQPAIDVVGNAAALDIATLLKRTVDGTSLIDCIANDDLSPLRPFAQDQAQAEQWLSGFKSVLENQAPSSHKLAKQVYFPTEEGYHLLGPLYASSLAGELHQRITDTRYSEAMKNARKARREGKYSAQTVTSFVGLASQSFGGTKPQNVSQLNSSRGGKGYLLSCRPPVWQRQLTLPIAHKHSFWREYDRRAWRTALALQKYLIKVLKRTSTQEIRAHQADFVYALIDILLMYAAEIRNATDKAGWSEKSHLTLAEKTWLDPLCEDEKIQQAQQTNDWQTDIAGQFADWLNRKLRNEKLTLEDAEFKKWHKVLKKALRTLRTNLEEMG